MFHEVTSKKKNEGSMVFSLAGKSRGLQLVGLFSYAKSFKVTI